jgi:glycosyltransferase involved in cell wall biosynthesis
MSYHANITMVKHLVDQIMPIVWSRRPDVRLWIVGKDPPREIRALMERGPIHVTGTVEDIRPYLRGATLAVAPLVYGAGIQNKVLESMACGAPVVATPQAVSAIQVLPGRDVCVAQGVDSFAASIVDLLDHPEQRNFIGEAGRNYVVTHHDWDRIAENLEEVYHGF